MNNAGMDRKTDNSGTWKTEARVTSQNETNETLFFHVVHLGILFRHMLLEKTLDLEHNGTTCCFVQVAKFYFPQYKELSSEITLVLLEDWQFDVPISYR